MAVGVIMDFATGGTAEYDSVIENMELGGRLPDGALFHAAGPNGGGWRVVDVWESPGAFQEFAATQIGPHTQAAGLPEPSIQFVEVDEIFDERDGGDGGATFVQIVRLSGMDRESFKDADSDIRENGLPPEGCVFHINGPSDDGWVVIDAWVDKDTRDAFIATKVAPAMQARGVAPPTIDDLSIHNTLTAA